MIYFFDMTDIDGSDGFQGNAGNTIDRVPRISPAKHWVFTWNNYPDNAREILGSMVPECKKITAQCEIAPTTGTKHIQGYIEFQKKVRPMGKLPKGVHWEKAKAFEAADEYCQKNDSRDPDGWSFTFPHRRPKCDINRSMLHRWQIEIEDMLETTPDPRKIYWYWEGPGGVGKSEFVKYMGLKYRGRVVATRAGRSADVLTSAAEGTEMYIIDFARNMEHGVPWNAIEQLKDGFTSDSKLKKKTETIFDARPHVIVFANFPPIGFEQYMSADKIITTHLRAL